MMALLSYLGSHWLLFIITMLAFVSLIALTIFLKNIKYALAAIAVILVGFAYQAIDMEGYKRRVNEDAQAQVELLKNRLLALSITTAIDNQHAVSDAYLNTKLKDLASVTPRNDGPCLDAAAAHRVWSISSPISKSLSAPARSSGPTNLLSWRIRPAR